MNIEIKTNYLADLVLHCLAHMKVNNNSNLYDTAYIDEINKIKFQNGFPIILEKEFEILQNYYNLHFGTLAYINFLPFYFEAIEDLYSMCFGQPFFTSEDKETFLVPFFNILRKEDKFYCDYWKRNKGISILKFENELKAVLESLGKLSEMISFTLYISLQQSMTRAGRACNVNNGFLIAVKFPKNDLEIKTSILQVIHEATHIFTDSLISTEIKMDDGTHDQTENLVIVADYLIISKHAPQMKGIYLEYFNFDNEEELFKRCPISEDLKKKLTVMFQVET